LVQYFFLLGIANPRTYIKAFTQRCLPSSFTAVYTAPAVSQCALLHEPPTTTHSLTTGASDLGRARYACQPRGLRVSAARRRGHVHGAAKETRPCTLEEGVPGQHLAARARPGGGAPELGM